MTYFQQVQESNLHYHHNQGNEMHRIFMDVISESYEKNSKKKEEINGSGDQSTDYLTGEELEGEDS